MHTVELMDRAIRVAEELGYVVRHEWLGGSGGGGCEFGGRKYLFVDLALTSVEQFDQVVQTIRDDPASHLLNAPDELSTYLRRAA